MRVSQNRTAIESFRWRLCILVTAFFCAFSIFAQEEGAKPKDASLFSDLVSVEELDRKARLQYAQMLRNAASQNALAPDDHPQLLRLRRIAKSLIPYSYEWNAQAKRWNWEVNLLGSTQINAFCLPGGKIAFNSGILTRLQLTDDEVAIVMGHEIAHALREHARARISTTSAVNGLAIVGGIFAAVAFGVNPQVTDAVAESGGTLLTLKFSRDDEIDADLVGMEIAARAGYDPRAGLSLWKKMSAITKITTPQWLSTHPSSATRFNEIEANLSKVLPLYEKTLSTHH